MGKKYLLSILDTLSIPSLSDPLPHPGKKTLHFYWHGTTDDDISFDWSVIAETIQMALQNYSWSRHNDSWSRDTYLGLCDVRIYNSLYNGTSRIVEGVPTLQVCRETQGFLCLIFSYENSQGSHSGAGGLPLKTALGQVQNYYWIDSFTPRENNGFFRLASM